jgi:hypothetical protein
MRKVHVIVPCASKQVNIPNELMFRNMPVLSVEDLFSEWRNTLKITQCDKVKAIDIYKGAYWQVVKDIYDNLSNNIWIIGAGYGIVNAEDEIKPYSAVFKSENYDNIAFKFKNKNNTYLDWWKMYNKNNISISNLYNEDDIFIITASYEYFKAIHQDVANIINKPNVFVISPDTKIKTITPYLTPSSLWLQQIFGGNKMTISALVVKHLIEILPKYNYDKTLINYYINDLITKCKPTTRKPTATKISDEKLLNIVKEIGIDKTKSFIYNSINKMGYACGPTRLHKLLYNLKFNENKSIHIR